MITRKVTIAGFDLNSYRDCLTKWNKAIEVMYSQCLEIGRSRCLPVYYEQLVLHPEQSMHAIMKFLDISWSDTVLHHEELIGKPGGVSLSKIERSTDQVIKPVNMEALSKWIGHIPGDVLQDMAHIAPMLARLGYDPYANPPNYGHPDPLVVNNTHRAVANGPRWPRKEEFAVAPVEICYPSILLANIAKMTAMRGMYLHLFAKAKRCTRRRHSSPFAGCSVVKDLWKRRLTEPSKCIGKSFFYPIPGGHFRAVFQCLVKLFPIGVRNRVEHLSYR
ncbi:hypothetical protein ASZ78_006679 [Callipepla squamata]|uniref:Protein-tyrosine sulfotransferase n=1 Tax=Callipepla squamata TaxID=9009 RepID=A0A226MV52_CALSU|nr:hypothetical protein ASZ78_006679 [Callipepla squamata]